jgi:hypothetical protein
VLTTSSALICFNLLILADDEGSHQSTAILAYAEDADDVDFGVTEFDDDDDDDDDAPALLEDANIDHDDDLSIDKCIAEEDGFLADGNIDNQLEDLDIHTARWRAYVVRKAADIGKSFEVEHKKSKTIWKWTLVEDYIPDKSTIEFQQVAYQRKR